MAPSCQIPIQILDVDAATDPTIQSVHDYWCSLNNGLPPTRRSFEFMKVYKAAPWLLLTERIAPQTDRFIYCGTTIAENLPRDLTGLVYTPQTTRMTSLDFTQVYTDVLETPCWRFMRCPVDWPNAEYSEYVTGSGPMTDDAGNLRYVLTCSIFVKKSPYTSRL